MRDPALTARGKRLEHMQRLVTETNQANGWYEDERTVGEDIALLHSEVSEMLEAYREWGTEDVTDPRTAYLDGTPYPSDYLPKPEGFGSECADVLIRLLDTCERRGIDLEAEFNRKVAYNRTRGYKHGGKRL